MYNSGAGLFAFLLQLILYRKALGKDAVQAGSKTASRFRAFLIASEGFFLFDAAWGFLYENRGISAVFPFLYSATVFYFIFMLLTMLTWARYIVAFLDKRGRRSKTLLYAVWAIFTLGLIQLMVNRFFPFIFSYTDDHEYVMEPGRYISIALQIALYVVISSYLLYIAVRSRGRERERYAAVGFTTLMLEVFQIHQFFGPQMPFYTMGLVLGTAIINSYVINSELRDKETYDNIATILAEGYEVMFYIDINTGEFLEFSKSSQYESMEVPTAGKDFYTETRENAARYAHPDDREFAVSLYYKDVLVGNLEGRKSFSYKYRIKVGEAYKFFLFTVMRAHDDRHFVLYVKDIEEDIMVEAQRKENQKKQVTFTRIAESLASNYDMIYYVDVRNSHYISYETSNIYGQLEIQQSGDDFFAESLENIPQIVHKSDRDAVTTFLSRDNMISALEDKKMRSLDYRLMVNGKPQYCRMVVRKTSDGNHFIIGVENVDAEVRKAKQQLKALNTEKELARRDELTGIKNKNAFTELEQTVQSNLDKGVDYFPFAIVVCDTNNLKVINDTEGHVAGDEYLKASAKLLCDIYVHSPVFRVGGDEFAVFLQSSDYANREALLQKLRDRVLENQRTNARPILASGMSEFIQGTDALVSEVFERADREMYENKAELKGGQPQAVR
ncbi:MAG: diguanylate cyclase [Lachnospiraceae bacterium]|nr:diguanylate cyclase [Lachnospiraceae bacterium]